MSEKTSNAFIWMKKEDIIKCCRDTITFVKQYRWMSNWHKAYDIAERFYSIPKWRRFFCGLPKFIKNKEHALELYAKHIDNYPFNEFDKQLWKAMKLLKFCRNYPDDEKILVGDEYYEIIMKRNMPFKMMGSKTFTRYLCPKCSALKWGKRSRVQYCFHHISEGLVEMDDVGQDYHREPKGVVET